MDEPYDMAGVPTTDRGKWSQVRDGRRFYPLDPRPEEVFIEDIAYSLSRVNRWNGFADAEIKVTQHLLNCRWMAHMDGQNVSVQYATLMHDAPEYIVGDMVRPLKCDMPAFREAEARIGRVINLALDVPDNDALHAVVKHYDNLAWAWEKRDHFKSSEEWPNTPKLPAYLPVMNIMTTYECEMMFLHEFRKLRAAHLERIRYMIDRTGSGMQESRDWRNT
jgi:hypothetical protein